MQKYPSSCVQGWREHVNSPENRPAWMPEKIWKPFVKKEKIETIE